MDNYNFKKFLGRGSRLGNYFISFGKSGFVISSGFYLRENINNFSKVLFFFDEDKKAVGIHFLTEDVDGAFALIHNHSKTAGSISARSFVVANNLNKAEYYGRKEPQKINYEGVGELFVIELVPANNIVAGEARG